MYTRTHITLYTIKHVSTVDPKSALGRMDETLKTNITDTILRTYKYYIVYTHKQYYYGFHSGSVACAIIILYSLKIIAI